MKPKKIILTAVIFLFCVLLLIYSDDITSASLTALSISVEKVIPVLFPYMVLSSIIISLGIADPIGRFIPMRFFALPDCAAPVLLTGILCGFPVGAAGSASLFRSGKLSRDEASRLCAAAGHVSPAFLIGTVGSLWGSKAFGWYLFACGILFTVVCGIFTGRKHRSDSHVQPVKTAQTNRDIITVFCQAVTGAAASCLNITGFIVFFRAAGAALSSVIPAAEPFTSVLFEFSAGCVYASEIGDIAGAALTGFAVGFSGFSVLAQTAAYISPDKIPIRPVLLSKLAEGIFTSAAAAFFCLLFPMETASDAFSGAADTFAPILIAVPAALAVIRYAGEFLCVDNKFYIGT